MKNSTLIEYLNQYSNLKINENATIEYFNFGWSLNGVK